MTTFIEAEADLLRRGATMFIGYFDGKWNVSLVCVKASGVGSELSVDEAFVAARDRLDAELVRTR